MTLLAECYEEVEADLARFYPRDDDQLPAFLAGRMSFRRLAILIHNIPPGGAIERGIERMQRTAKQNDMEAREARFMAHEAARRAQLAEQEGTA